MGRQLSVSQLDVVVGRARAAKAFPLLLREQLISKTLISKRQELRQIKHELLHNANSRAKGTEYRESYGGYCLPIFFRPNHKALEIARDVKAHLAGKKHERREFKQRRSKVCAAQAARDRAALHKMKKEKIQQKRAPIAVEKGTLPDFVIIGAKKCGTSTLASARSPRRDQAYGGASDVFEPISSTNISRPASMCPSTIARQAALKNSSRSAAPTDLFSY